MEGEPEDAHEEVDGVANPRSTEDNGLQNGSHVSSRKSGTE